MYIVYNESLNSTGNGYDQGPDTSFEESRILLTVAGFGMLGNLAIVICILFSQDLRKTSSAFLFHHSILDFVKSAYCLPFAYSIINDREPIFCNILGGSFIIFVTTSSFNLLALVMNEAYQFADMNLGIRDSANFCCVAFGICMIWFTSLILNMGVAFIPGNPSYNREIAHCIFIYGIIGNYVLHVLWICLVSFAMVLTVMYLRKLHRDIKMNAYYRFSTLIRATMHLNMGSEDSPQMTPDEQAERILIKKIERYSLRKVYILMTMTILYVLFWYPLFMLTLVDPNFTASRFGYRILTIFACSNAAITPVIFICLIKKNCCCYNDFPNLQLSQAPETASQMSLESLRHMPQRILVTDRPQGGVYNEIFSPSSVTVGGGYDDRGYSDMERLASYQAPDSPQCSYGSAQRPRTLRMSQPMTNSYWSPSL